MKKLIALIVVVFFTTAGFAQENKMETKPETKTSTKSAHECYMMKEGAVYHCTGDNQSMMKTDATLKNGTVITRDGTVRMKDGSTQKLENGQCVSLMGGIGDCDAMHAKSKEPMHMEKK
jgi:hypothetical protein